MFRAFTHNTDSFNVSNSYNNTTQVIFTATDDGSKILAWLSPLEPQERHHDISDQRVDGIGNWLLETGEFRSWYNGETDHAALFCYGDPGVGKSYIWYERQFVQNKRRLLLTASDG